MQNRSLLLALVFSVWVLAALCALPAIPVFDCPSLPTPPAATNVNQLRPGNIKVIMAVGDSITAGFAMNAAHITNFLKISSDIKESRQDVFSIGGGTSNSLPSYFSFYNPSLQGASVGQTSPLSIKNDYMAVSLPDASAARLNAAESGAIADDIISQINYLRDTMLSPLYAGTIDFKNDWKHLTVLIGANNLCQACVNETRASPDNYEAALDGAFAYLRSQIPRVFVSVITMFKLSTVYNTFQTSTYCKTARATVFTSECLCIAKDYSAAGLQKVDDYSVEYNNRLYKLAAKYQALNDPEFTIKVQPATQNFSIPASIGVQFLSEFDCFHPSAFADATMGVALWNNLMAGSQANKQTTIDPFNSKLTCPDANTFLV